MVDISFGIHPAILAEQGLGLQDRAQAIGGTMLVTSPHDGGTSLVVELPLEGNRPHR